MKRVLFVCIFVFLFLFLVLPLQADLYDDLSRQIDELNKTFAAINSANQTNETQLQGLQKKLDSIKSQVAVLEREIEKKQAQVAEGEKAFAVQQKLLNQRAKSYYKNMGKNSFSIVNLLLSENISESLQNYFYQKTLVDEDKKAIIRIAVFIKQVGDQKKELETEKTQLAAVKVEVDKQSTFLAGEVAKTKTYLGELQSKIVDLSSQQQALLSAKINSIPLPRSAQTSLGGCVPDVDLSGGSVKDSGFGGSKFAFFSFGVPNKIGMNQYGAWGRAKAGRNETEILQAYYNFDQIETVDTNINIKVNDSDGFNAGNIIWSDNLEEYVKRVYEMPSGWTENNSSALKAQVIAIRSYVLAATDNGNISICANEHCQVFKTEPKDDVWKQAVSDTAGKVMKQGGKPIKAWFSSTHGGIILASGEIGWSSTDWTKHGGFDASGSVNNFSDLKNNAYDRESKWFYCDWGYRSQYNNTAWLKPEEVADIVNAYLLYSKDKNTTVHLGRTDSSDVPDTWDASKVKEELRNRGESPLDSVNNIEVAWDSSGISQTVIVDGRSLSAQRFKNIFNLRAPANIQIKPACNLTSSDDIDKACTYALFNVEKR